MTTDTEDKKCTCDPDCNCECACEKGDCDEACLCETKDGVKVEEPAYISIDDFKKVEITIGKILEVEVVEGADKLLKLTVDTGDESPRQVISGIREYFDDPQSIVGKRVPFATNLQPRTIRGHESNGMIVAVSDKEGNGFSLLEAGDNITPGSTIS
jgi:methionyl-tRNA synthetase